MKQVLFSLFMFAVLLSVQAQNKYTVSGRVKDQKTGEELIGVMVKVNGQSIGTVTNSYGFFSLTLLEGKYKISFSYIGYKTLLVEVDLKTDVVLRPEMSDDKNELKEVKIQARKGNDNIESTRMSVMSVDIQSLKKMPALLGEVDILRALQFMPGVQTGGEGSTGFYVRGGNVDQNLILLDEAIVYNPSHLFGFFSVFNADAIKDAELYKGAIPAQFGGRLSSVLDVKMKDGNSKHFSASGGIGTISSRLTLEGPLIKEKSSFIISARRTYADMFLKLSPDKEVQKSKLYFYDLNAKVNYTINDNNRVFISGYFGRDILGFDKTFTQGWGNATGTLRWNHVFNKRLFSNVTLISSSYNYKLEAETEESQGFLWKSDMSDQTVKGDFTYYLNPKNTIRFGSGITWHALFPGKVEPNNPKSVINEQKLPVSNSLEHYYYFANEQKISTRFTIDYGIRFSMFHNVGSATVFTYGANRYGNNPDTKDSVDYGSGVIYNTYSGWEPRFSMKYSINENSSVKASYNRTYQYLHLVSNTNSASPTDIYVNSSPNIKPQYADQVAAGYFRNFIENTLQVSAEVYYKKMHNQVDYVDNANLFLNKYLESQLLAGTGTSYGLELMVKRKAGKIDAWMSYTLSKADRKIDGINNNKSYPTRYDHRNNLSWVCMYEYSKKWTFSANFIYVTGGAFTAPNARYEFDGYVVPYVSSRNNYRMPDYHRLDVAATLYPKKYEGKKFKANWTFSLFNAYGRKNAYSIVFRQREGYPSTYQAVKTYLFTFIPSVTWNYKF
jgi:hypothetical protein